MEKHLSDLYTMSTYAIKAPSSHNTQPWIIFIKDNGFEIYPDFSNPLTIADNLNRELYISLGCAIENICLAANEKGYGEALTFILNENQQVNVRIDLSKGTANPSALFSQINKRQTNRSVFFDREIPEKEITKLTNLKLDEGIKHFIYRYNDTEFNLIRSFVREANEIQLADDRYKDELLSWIRFSNSQINQFQNGLSYKTLGVSIIPPFLRKIIIKSQLKASAQNKADEKRMQTSSHFVLFTCEKNTPEEWIKLGRSLQRFLLQTCKMKIASGFLNQPCEVEVIADKMKDCLQIENRHPAILLRIGYAHPVAYSPRKQASSIIFNK